MHNIVKLKHYLKICYQGPHSNVYNIALNLKQVDIIISKNQALQILYFKQHVYKTS